MTYRFDTRFESGWVVLLFQGVLDRAALGVIRARVGEPALRGAPIRLDLLARTEVDSSCIRELTRLEGVEVVAHDPFLRRWLESCR